jgi:hypothetical protein
MKKEDDSMDKVRHLLIRLLCLEDKLPNDSTIGQAHELELLAKKIRGSKAALQQTDDLSGILANVKELLLPLAENKDQL